MCPSRNKKYDGTQHRGDDHSSPYPVSRMAPATELIDLAHVIAHADETIASHVNSKLKLIAKQIQSLQAEAEHILKQAQRDQTLHRATCQSQRIVGKTYYLYSKHSGERYFSLLSPRDWHGQPPHPFLGAYRLEQDMSWTEIDDLNLDAQSEL